MKFFAARLYSKQLGWCNHYYDCFTMDDTVARNFSTTFILEDINSNEIILLFGGLFLKKKREISQTCNNIFSYNIKYYKFVVTKPQYIVTII